MFFHKIGGFALQQSSPLIIYAYASLSLVALYGNYYMIILGIISLMAAISNSMGAGVGNLVAEGNHEKIVNVFWELFSVRFFIATTFCFCAYKLIPSFVVLWIGPEYLLPQSTLILLIIILYIQMFRYLVNSYLDAYAMTRDIWAPIVEASINIGGSIILGRIWGLNGILSAVVMSLLIMVEGWKPFFLIREGMTYSVKKYILRYVAHFIAGAVAFIGSIYIASHIKILQTPPHNWFDFVISIVMHFCIYTIFLFIVMYISFLSFRQFILRLKHIIV